MGLRLSRREALGLLLGAGIAGCRVPGAREAPAETRPTLNPRPGGVLKVGYHTDPVTLDPHAGVPAALPLMGLIYSRLVRFRTGREVHPNQLIPEPDLVESWEQTDEVTYAFHLRKGVRFHPRPPVNGRELVADDVRATLEWLMGSPDPRHRLHFGRIDRVEVPDKYTVKVILKEVTAPFIHYLAGPYGWILPRELVGQQATMKTGPVGTGPFILHERFPGISLIFRKNPDYFRPNRPYVDEVHWLIIPDETARLAYFWAGALDIIPPAVTTSPTQFDAVRQARPEVQAEEVVGADVYYLKIRTDLPLLADRRARQALALAVDRQALLGWLGRGHGIPAGALSPSLVEWALAGERLGPAGRYYGFDPELAVELAAEAGLRGLSLRLRAAPAWLEALREQFAQVGVDLVPGNGSAELSLEAYSFFLDPDEQLTVMFEGSGSTHDPLLAELIRRQRRILNKAARRQLLDEIQAYLAEQQYFIGLVALNRFGLWQPYVRGYRPHSGPGSYELVDTWLEK